MADGHAQIRAGRSSFRLPTLPVEDFPAISASELPHQFTVTAADLRDMIDTTRFAISTEETRYYLNGIYFHKSASDMFCAVATDGHRLALSQMTMPQGASDTIYYFAAKQSGNCVNYLMTKKVMFRCLCQRQELNFHLVLCV